MTQKCKNCKSEYSGQNHFFCSQSCQWDSKRKARTWGCVTCGVPFYHKTGKEINCSPECFTEYRHQKKMRALGRSCNICGIDFVASNQKQKYCGYECSSEARKKRERVICEWCKSGFEAKSCRSRRFCSLKCRGEWQSSLPYDAWKKKLSENRENRAKGKNNGMYGVSPPHPKPIKFCDRFGRSHNLRSSWEIKVARYLDKAGLTWDYEPKRFDMEGYTYTPDFYIHEDDVYWEVKGWFNEKSKKKTADFRRLHSDCQLVLITKTVFNMIDRELSGEDAA